VADSTDENQSLFAQGTNEKEGIVSCDLVGGVHD